MACSGRGADEEGETGDLPWRSGWYARLHPGEYLCDGSYCGRGGELHRRVSRGTEAAIGVGDAVFMAVDDGDRSGKSYERNAQEADQQAPARDASYLPLRPLHMASIVAGL